MIPIQVSLIDERYQEGNKNAQYTHMSNLFDIRALVLAMSKRTQIKIRQSKRDTMVRQHRSANTALHICI